MLFHQNFGIAEILYQSVHKFKERNLHSMFVVREITDTESRGLKQWWFITFERLAQFASWNQQGGGTNMQGGGSTVVKIPKDQFLPMSKAELDRL